MIERRPVGKQAVAYIQEQLKQGGVLSRLLLRYLELGPGVAWTYVPAEVDQAIVDDLAYGSVAAPVARESYVVSDGYAVVPVVAPSRPIIVGMIVRFLRSHSDAYCVFEDALVRASDPVMKAENAHYMAYGDEVLYYASREDADLATVSRLMSLAEHYLLTGVLSRVAKGTRIFQPQKPLSSHELELIVRGTETIVLRAYDGEGYVAWSKRSE
jgi:hypothetical protein